MCAGSRRRPQVALPTAKPQGGPGVLGERRFGLLFLVAAAAHVVVVGGASEAVARGWVGSPALLFAESSHRGREIEVDIEPAVLALPRVQVPLPPPPPSP